MFARVPVGEHGGRNDGRDRRPDIELGLVPGLDGVIEICERIIIPARCVSEEGLNEYLSLKRWVPILYEPGPCSGRLCLRW
jgi:hypothetical protein